MDCDKLTKKMADKTTEILIIDNHFMTFYPIFVCAWTGESKFVIQLNDFIADIKF